jgi:hypothetical protein
MRVDNVSGEDFGASGVWAGFGNYYHRPFGLNEAKKLLLWKFTRVPVTKTYTFDWWGGATVPDEPAQRYVAMRYVLTNNKASNLGLFPLQHGKARIFQKDGHGGEAFLGEDWGQFTPIDDKMRLYLGLARDVVVKRKITRNERKPIRGNLYNQELIVHYTIENFKNTAIVLDVLEDMNRLRDQFCGKKNHDAEWQILEAETSLPLAQIERRNSRTAFYHIPLEAAPKGEGEVKSLVSTVHILMKNEW